MDYLEAVDIALRDAGDLTDADSVRAALRLADMAWRLYRPPDGMPLDWRQFGVIAEAGHAEQCPGEDVREAAARFAVAVAGYLDGAATNPDTSRHQRREWKQAAARLRRADHGARPPARPNRRF